MGGFPWRHFPLSQGAFRGNSPVSLVFPDNRPVARIALSSSRPSLPLHATFDLKGCAGAHGRLKANLLSPRCCRLQEISLIGPLVF